jgi:heat shock protein HslJ
VKAILVAGMVCTVAACVVVNGPPDAGAAKAVPLVGTNWVLTDKSALGVSLSGVAVTASFAEDTLAGESGCNAYNTSYSVNGRRMTIGADIATTLRACPPGPAAVERAYLTLLPKTASFEISGSTLSLSDKNGKQLLVYRASTGAKALRGRWNVTAYYSGNAITSVVGNARLTAVFTSRNVSGNGGCNSFSGPYRASGSAIQIGPLASTLRLCGNAALDTQEAQYLSALQLATTFRVTGPQLVLLRADGGIAVELAGGRT